MKIVLVDYKGKYDIATDIDRVDDAMDTIVGSITKEALISEARLRAGACRYYGIPAYIGKDKELTALFEKLSCELDKEDDMIKPSTPE